jgi:hypothetical protein
MTACHHPKPDVPKGWPCRGARVHPCPPKSEAAQCEVPLGFPWLTFGWGCAVVVRLPASDFKSPGIQLGTALSLLFNPNLQNGGTATSQPRC